MTRKRRGSKLQLYRLTLRMKSYAELFLTYWLAQQGLKRR